MTGKKGGQREKGGKGGRGGYGRKVGEDIISRWGGGK